METIQENLVKLGNVIVAQTACLGAVSILSLCFLTFLIKTNRQRPLYQYIMVLVLIFSPVIGTDGKIDLDGETMIVRNTAFSLLGRPYMVENKHIFHQVYNISNLLELFQKMDFLGQFVIQSCKNYVEKIDGIHYEDAKAIGLLDQEPVLQLPKYLVINRAETSVYEAQLACEERGMKLPEPLDEKDLKDISLVLKKYMLPRVATGTIFDFGLYTWRFKHNGKIPDTNMYGGNDNTWYATDLKDPEGTADLRKRIDDRNSQLYIENPGRLVFRTSGTENYGNSYIEAQYSYYDYLKNKQTPVVCQTSGPRTSYARKMDEEAVARHKKEWARTIDLCHATGHHINKTALVLMNQFARIVNEAGLSFEEPTGLIRPMKRLVNWATDSKDRSKRVIWAGLAKMITFVPGLALDIYKEYVVDRRIKKAEANIDELTKTLRKQSTSLNTIDIRVDDLEKLTQEITSIVSKLYKLVTSVSEMHAVTQVLTAMIIHHNELVVHAQDSLGQLETVLTSLLNQKVPISMSSNLKKFVATRDHGPDTFMLSPDKPVGLDPVIKDNVLHVYTTFLEGTTTYDLYQVIPLPSFEGENAVTRQIPYEYVLLDGSQTSYAPIDADSVLFCTSGVCPARHVLHKVADDRCGVRALTDTPFDENCPVLISTNEPKFYQTAHGIIYAVPTRYKGKLACKGKNQNKAGSEGNFHTEGVGILTIPTGCDLTLLRPDVVLQGPVPEIFRTIANLELIRSTFDGLEWSARAHDLAGNLSTLTQNWISQRIETHSWYFYLIIIIVVIIGLVIISVIVVKIWLVAKSYQKWKGLFKGFRENIHGEVQRVKYLLNTFWKLLHPSDRENVNRRLLREKEPEEEEHTEEGSPLKE